MGNLLSVAAPSGTKPRPVEAKVAILGTNDGSSSKATPTPTPLFLSDVKAEPATWSQEGICLTIQRLFGMLPDSEVRYVLLKLSLCGNGNPPLLPCASF